MDYPGDDKAWCIRTCAKDGTSYGGFKWPSEIGAIVKCDDWDTTPKCGNGLHGLLDGFGDYSLLSSEADAIWQIVLVDRNGCVEIDGKVKFASCELVFVGDMAAAMTMMAKYQINLLLHAADANAASGHSSQLAASGDYSKLAASGDYSKLAASGDYSKLAASGHSSQLAASGDYSKLAASGDSSQLAASGDSSRLAASGHSSQLAASGHSSRLAASGHSSQLAASGDYSQLAASGHSSQLAASGDYSKLAASGDYSQLAASGHSSKLAASGDYSKLAASGDKSIAICCGLQSIAMAGNDGCIALTWFDAEKNRYRVEVAYVGENGIKPNVYYRLNDEHRFEEAL